VEIEEASKFLLCAINLSFVPELNIMAI